MESEDEQVSDNEFEFSADELEEAVKRKPGRPSNRTRELRENIKDAQRLTSILGILDSGILEQLSERFDKGFSEGVRDGDIRVNKDIKTTKAPKGFTTDLLKRSGLVKNKFLKTNEQLLNLFDDVVQNSLTIYGPPVLAVVGGLGALWVAESQIKEFPPILHTSFGVTVNMLKLLATLTKFLEEMGGFANILDGTDIVDDDGNLDIKKVVNFLIFGPIGTALGLGF